jgi:hypothetical protein
MKTLFEHERGKIEYVKVLVNVREIPKSHYSATKKNGDLRKFDYYSNALRWLDDIKP